MREELESRLERFQKSQPAPGNFSPLKGLYLVGSLGFVVAISIVVGIFGGFYLDKHLGTKPWFTLLGLLLGLGAAARAGYELVRSTLKNKE